MYEVMHHSDEDRPAWDSVERYFAAAWRAQPKWVDSQTLRLDNPKATVLSMRAPGGTISPRARLCNKN